jgi:hypothetical protein
MARPERIVLEVPIKVGVGAPVNVFRLRDKTVQISGAFTGAVQIEGSIDGDDFEPIATRPAPGFVQVPLAVAFLRIRVTELTAGVPKALVAGFDFRAV